ncbi:MAG TPA: serine hydrolase [Sphingobacteriaceae bacterium]
MLTHTSSTRDGKAYYASYSCGDPVISLQDWIKDSLTPGGKYYNNGDGFGDQVPGSGERKYSNIGFGILGLIVEKIAKEPFNEYCKKHIFDVLGMHNTGWLLSEVNSRNHIVPYAFITQENEARTMERKVLFGPGTQLAQNTLLPYCLYSFPNYPDGLVRTTLPDLSVYLMAMMNGGKINGNRILKKTTVQKMLSLQLEGSTAQGLAWHRETLSGQPV